MHVFANFIQYQACSFCRVGLNLPSIRSVGSNRMSATIELCKSGSICPARCPVEFSLNRGAVYTIGEVIHVSFRSVSVSRYVITFLEVHST